MRRKLLTLAFAVLVIAVAVPLGAALTLERHRTSAPVVATTTVAPAGPAARALAEAGSLIAAGGLLIGAATFVRRRPQL